MRAASLVRGLGVALAPAMLMLAGCMTPPKDLDLSLQHPSAHQRFVVALHPRSEPVPLQTLHAWEVSVTTPDGQPVTHAQIDFDGGMPQHGHGFPTHPRVTRELSPGVYALEGVKFSMTGWWDMRLAIRAGEAVDSATFNVVVEETGLRR